MRSAKIGGLSSNRLFIAAAVIAITALGFFVFPGQTWLQQDTQIYVPILEHLHDPSVLANDPVATNQHFSYTIYDEVVLALRRMTGASFYAVMTADQLVFRAAGILGVFLIGTALGLPWRMALLVAAVYALGAAVMGPAVLTVEYEPKPRGSAIGMMLLALGFVGHGRLAAAGIAVSGAFLYHPPTTYPFWLVTLAILIHPPAGSRRAEYVKLIAPAALAAALLVLISRLQSGSPEAEYWFARLSPMLEELQRFRAAYNWISSWVGDWIWHYLLLWAMAMAAVWRLRDAAPGRLQPFLIGLPLTGMLSVPFSYLFYDVGKWAILAKFQPARALLWVPAIAVILLAAACLKAAGRKRKIETLAFGVFAFMIAIEHNVLNLLAPDPGDPVILRRCLLAVFCGGLLALAGWLQAKPGKAALTVWAAAMVLPFGLLPTFGGVVTERNMHHVELDEVAAWAARETALDDVFLFPDTGKGRQPGIFRAKALRPIYVDWKSGGQVNMVLGFARAWWERYNATLTREFSVKDFPRYQTLGIDYVVVQPQNRIPELAPAFENSQYLVYPVRQPPATAGQ